MIGQIIGAFRIEQKIGEGGMGAVYRGRDLMLEREVAVKALRPELARQPELVARFRSEAVTLARLNHSHIATLYNFLRHGDDYFMVMEFVRGRTLDELIRQTGALEIERAVRLFCQALEGIAHAHALGVIHRDIKPANIMLTANDEVKVMDFGIARVLGSARQTKTGRLIGTLEYMSPEQMRSQETDARSDIYSLGILLYEMLTGRVPFQASSDYELMRAQVEDEPVAPRDFKGDIPLAVELAILRALAKDPAARFQSAIEFRAALVSAVPAAALRPEPAKVIAEAEPAIKATRAAAGFDEVNFSEAWAGFDEQIKETRLPQRQSGFDRHSGTFTLKLPSFLLTARQSVEARLGPLNWKHYSAACAAILALGIGLSSMRGSHETPAPKQAEVVVTPTLAPISEAPAPTIAPPVVEPVITPPETAVIPPVESAPTPARAKRAATPKPRRQSDQQADNNRPAPPPSRAEPQRAQAAPTPTPAPEKKKWWEKAAEVGVGVTDAIIRKKKGRP
jgi:serine/threonine-protein kinase